jgi:hypothetical protein
MADQEQIGLLRDVVGALDSMSVPYMIGVSIALNVWATPRMTHDFDIVIDLPEERIAEFCSSFSHDRFFIDPDDMRAAFHKREEASLGMYSFLDMDTGFKVDLFPVRPNDPAQQMALTRRVEIEVLSGVSASVYTPDDLLIQKLRWYAASDSERQFRDCLNLLLIDLKRPKPLISHEYVQGWVSRLGESVQEAWQRVSAAVDEAVRSQDHE